MGATDDQLRALGRLTTEFSFLELTVKQVILGLLHKDERDSGMILTAHLSFARLCDAAAAIAHERMKNVPGAVDQLGSILKRVRTLATERNRLIHSIWVLSDDPSAGLSQIRITAKRKLDIQLEPQVPPEDLNRTADEIYGAAVDLVLFLDQHGRYPE